MMQKKKSVSRRNNTKQSFAPPGWPSLIPRVVVVDAEEFVSFLRQVFDATGDYLPDRPAEMHFGDSILMVTDTGVRPATAAFLYLYVKDVDATYARALEAGARSIEEPCVMPYGDRRCMIKDGWGNIWQIATPQRGRDRGTARRKKKVSVRRIKKR